MCHISDFKECTNWFQLAEMQEYVFTAFFDNESLDIGLGAFKPCHVQGALCLVEAYANAHNLKKYHPIFEFMSSSTEFVSKDKTFRIAALAWYCWGVLNEDVAFYGAHLMTLGIKKFGYTRDYTGTVVHALPYMKDWFTTTLSRDKGPMYTSYVSWLEQLESEHASLSKIRSGSKSSERELTTLIEERTGRLEKAKSRTGDWLVEWLETSIAHDPLPPYNIFQAVFVSNLFDSKEEDVSERSDDSRKQKKRRRDDSRKPGKLRRV